MNRRTFALAAALVIAPSLAFAGDNAGPAGHVAELQVNTPSSDAYLAYHGRVFVDGGNGKGTSEQEYRWGGAACGTKTVSDAQIALLMRGLDGGFRIAPIWQAGQGSSQCLVGFSVLP